MFFWQPLATREVWLGSSVRLWSPANRLHKPAATGTTKGYSWYSPCVWCVSPCATQRATEILTKLYRFTAQWCTAVTPQSFSESALEKGGQRQIVITAVAFEQGRAGQSHVQNQKNLMHSHWATQDTVVPSLIWKRNNFFYCGRNMLPCQVSSHGNWHVFYCLQS